MRKSVNTERRKEWLTFVPWAAASVVERVREGYSEMQRAHCARVVVYVRERRLLVARASYMPRAAGVGIFERAEEPPGQENRAV